MNCHRARNLLFDFFDGVSNEASRAEVERHLGECVECERFASEMTRSLALLRRAPAEPLDETFNWKVRLAIHRERNAALSRAQSAGIWVRRWNARYAMSSALAFGAVLAVGALLLRDGGPGSENLTVPGAQVAWDAANVGPPAPASVSRSGVTPRNHDGILVSGGDHGTDVTFEGPPAATQGAIDETPAEARIDSLINSDVRRMTASERDLYIQRRIERLRSHLQSQQPSPAQR